MNTTNDYKLVKEILNTKLLDEKGKTHRFDYLPVKMKNKIELTDIYYY